jgi:hypothetical protein
VGGKGSGVRNVERRDRIKRLLAQKPVLNFSQIGEMVGVSRERVRQLAAEFGVTGQSGRGSLRGRRPKVEGNGK